MSRPIQTRFDIASQVENTGLLTQKNIAVVLMTVMQQHIGKKNMIPRSKLYKAVYKKQMDNSLESYFRMEMLRKAMHLCRCNTECFIVSSYDKDISEWGYFVVKDSDDAKRYCNALDRVVLKVKYMKQRANTAADEEWYKRDWSITKLESTNQNKLIK